MQRLQWIDQHAGDVVAGAQHAQRRFRHVVQRVGLMRRHRIADAGLHVAPPAVIGAAEPHEVRFLGVIARKPHGLHHGLGAGHVERHFVEAGDGFQTLHVRSDRRVVRAEHRAERICALEAAGHAVFIKVIAEDVDAIRAGEVVERIAVEIGDHHAGRRLQKRADAQVLADHAVVLERHAVGFGELHVRDAGRRFFGQAHGLGVALLVERGKLLETDPAALDHAGGRVIGRKEPVAAVFIKRYQPGDTPGHLGMSRQRAVLRARQFQTGFEFDDRSRERCSAKCVQRVCGVRRIHRLKR